jgi:hemolysin-activating ACP:hemolysin acyltransferase
MSFFSKKSKDQPTPPPAAKAAAAAPARTAAAPPARVNGAAAPEAAPLNPEQIKAGFERSRRTLIALGEIASVLMKSAEYRNMTLANLQALAAPAISTGQFMVLTAHQKSRGAAAPVALALWANVSAEVDRKLSQADGQNVALTPADWSSGDIAWLIVVAGDQRTLPALIAQLQKTKLKDKVIKLRTKDESGAMSVRTLPVGGAVTASAAKGAAKQPVKH